MDGGKRRGYPEYKKLPVVWLPTLPSNWEVRRLKFCAELVNAKTAVAEQDLYVGLENVESCTGRHLPSEVLTEPESVVNRFSANDVLFGKLRPYLAKVWKAERPGVCSTEFFVLRGKQYEPPFLRWLCLSSWFVGEVDGSTFGSKMPRASWDNVGELQTPLPPSGDQRAIAAYLDREIARIDALMEKKRRLVNLLQEKRAAVIAQAVTRGIHAGTPLRESGVSWFDKVPSHWDVKRLRYLTPSVTVGIVVTPSKYYEDEGVPALRSFNVKPGAIDDQGLAFISEESNQELSKSQLREGDLVSVRTGNPGTTAVVPSKFHGSNCVDLIITRRSIRFDSTFLCFFMNSTAARGQFEQGSGGALQQHFNIETAKNLAVPTPPLEEQKQIASCLLRSTETVDRLMKTVETAVDRLCELRSALIDAAVTGQIDIREAA